MKKIIVKELTQFFNANNLIPLSQHGFLPGRFTTTNLLECLNDWTENHDNSQLTDILYLDYEKSIRQSTAQTVRGQLLTLISDTLYQRYY